MTLERLLGRLALIGSVSLFGYNCDSATPDSCSKDTDCKGDRVCVSGVCQQQGSYGGDAAGGSDGNSSTKPCGNSPLYGKHMWEISKCEIAFHMREDCLVGIAIKSENYNYVTDYNSLTIGLKGHPSFNSSIRFIDGPNQNKKWQDINKILDLYQGYILLYDSCKIDHMDDCAFVALNNPYKSTQQCQNSPYYVKPIQP